MVFTGGLHCVHCLQRRLGIYIALLIKRRQPVSESNFEFLCWKVREQSQNKFKTIQQEAKANARLGKEKTITGKPTSL